MTIDRRTFMGSVAGIASLGLIPPVLAEELAAPVGKRSSVIISPLNELSKESIDVGIDGELDDDKPLGIFLKSCLSTLDSVAEEPNDDFTRFRLIQRFVETGQECFGLYGDITVMSDERNNPANDIENNTKNVRVFLRLNNNIGYSMDFRNG